MSLFDLSPKDSRRALFGRDRELGEFVRLMEHGRWTVVLGPRMVGKTSLVKSALSLLNRPTVYANLWGTRGTHGLLHALVAGLNEHPPLLRRIAGVLRRIQGVSVGGAGVSVTPLVRPLRTTSDLVQAIGSAAGAAVIVLDEVQELAPASRALLRVLANIFNSYPRITFVFTGSYFGLLRTLLEPGSESPLYGRPPARLDLSPFDRETSIDFLERGFQEHRLRVGRQEIGNVVDRSLDGIPGWLTLYGNYLAIQRLKPPAAERATVEEAKRVIGLELGNFLAQKDAQTYWRALKAIAFEPTWSELRGAISAERGTPVNPNSIANILHKLRDAGLIDTITQHYRIRDPLVRTYVREARRPPRSRS